MSHPSKRKGDDGERELAELFAELTGWPVKRELGAGRQDDRGDLHGVPETTIQVKNYPNALLESINKGLPQLRKQQANAGSTFGVLFCRRKKRRNGQPHGHWIAVMELDQLVTLLREAIDE